MQQVRVPTPHPKESLRSFSDRAFAAQVQAEMLLQGHPAEYQKFCTALRSEWAKLKARKTSKKGF